MEAEYQTRNNKGDVRHFNTFKEAIDQYKQDPSVDKISFGEDRWICVRQNGQNFSQPVMETLNNLSQMFSAERDINRVYWVRMQILPEHSIMENLLQRQRQGEISKEKLVELWTCACIKEVVTEACFFNRFGYY